MGLVSLFDYPDGPNQVLSQSCRSSWQDAPAAPWRDWPFSSPRYGQMRCFCLPPEMLNNIFKNHAQHQVSFFFFKLMFDVFCIYVNIQWTSSRYESWILWPSHHQDHEIFLGSGGYLLWMYKIPINNAINYHINWWTPNFFPSTPPKTNGWHLKMLPQKGKREKHLLYKPAIFGFHQQ